MSVDSSFTFVSVLFCQFSVDPAQYVLSSLHRLLYLASCFCFFFFVLQVVIATTGLVGSVTLIASVHKFGKRSISLASTSICAVSFLLLGLYAYLFITPSTLTADDTYLIPTWVPLVLFAVLSFANAIQAQMPWLLVTEVFPYRYVTMRLPFTHAPNFVYVVREKFLT